MENKMKRLNKKFLLVIMIFISFVLSACALTDFFNTILGDGSENLEDLVSATLTVIAIEGEAQETQTAPTAIDSPTPEATPTTTTTPEGTITGQLSYPSEFLPPQRVVAFEANDNSVYFSTEVSSDSTYTLTVPPSTYVILSYLIDPADLGAQPGLAGAYSEAVLCGLEAGCDDHSLVPVVVNPGETVTGIDPADWYLPVGERADWPSDPTKVSTGSITGDLGYPSEYIPPQRVVAFNVFSDHYYYVDTILNQRTYEISDLPVGTYNVVAYVIEEGPDFAGGYSQFVVCGMTTDCTDHRLIDVDVYAGMTVEDVDPIDFYTQEDEAGWPENPTD